MDKKPEKSTSKSAMVLYRPVGIVSGLIAGMIARKIFDQVWKRATPGPVSDPPGPLETEYPVKEILAAAAIQGAIFFVVRTIVQRQGAKAFERWTGEWPGD